MAKKRPTTPKSNRPARKATDLLPQGYAELLAQLKERIRSAQLRAFVAVNRELIELYWHIGRSVADCQKTEGWGKAVIDHLGDDLQKAFPGMTGFSRTNVYRMRAFYLAYQRAGQIVPQPVGQISESGLPLAVAGIPWGHNIVLVEQSNDLRERLWYARATVENGWSRSVLVHWIESGLYKRQGKAQTNFEKTLPAFQSDLARETLKDPYSFEFLTVAADVAEQELERGLVAHRHQHPRERQQRLGNPLGGHYSKKNGQPGPRAYKLGTLIINRRIEEARRSVARVLKLGSLSSLPGRESEQLMLFR
ncbi:MAG: DUF1016 N-terminal domain-containing protein [Isosphaeraceae bacterium]|nr:DUF1016 N-terminal domain-containing protein [Isosphaeraceae bacterium]